MVARGARLAAALAALAAALGCAPRAPAPAAPDPLALPKAYRVQADGELTVNDLRVGGRLRMDYLVFPDDRVVVSDLTAWVRDVDIVSRFAFIETGRERLRCTKLSNTTGLAGRLEPGGRLVLPPGAVDLSGVSFAERGAGGRCTGLARQVTAQNNADVVARHDPAADRFELSGTFRGRHGGEDLAIGISMTGRFLNRPPVATLGVFEPPAGRTLSTVWPDDLDLPQGGCPPLRGSNPAGAVANAPDGLRLDLISLSSDPDGRSGGGRGDLARDVWSLSTDGGPFRALGTRQIVGPVLFELHRDHVLALTSSDHAGASARALCRFRVISAAEAGVGGGS